MLMCFHFKLFDLLLVVAFLSYIYGHLLDINANIYINIYMNAQFTWAGLDINQYGYFHVKGGIPLTHWAR